MTGDVRRAIAEFRSRTVSLEAADFARLVTLLAAPGSPQRARALLFATSKLAEFGLACGLELRPEVMCHTSVIERFCTSGCPQMSPASVRTIRTNLRFVAHRVLDGGAARALIPRERAKSPYSAKEISSYLRLADSQPTDTRRHHAAGLICLGAGAGLIGEDLRTVTGAHVVCRSGGVVVEVTGIRPRRVPVLREFHDRLLASAEFVGHRYVVGGEEPWRKNVTTPVISALAGGSDLERLSVRRLRATWLSRCASSLGLRAFMDAAGIACSQRLGDIVSHLDPVSEPESVMLLGATR